MTQSVFARLESNRKFMPLGATIGLFLFAYLAGAAAFPGMRDSQAFMNLFITTPFLLICVVGETFVIISGGIDLSVSGVLALSTVVAASLIQQGWSPWQAFPVILLMGMTFGLVMGLFITYLKVQPFIATLAGMWLARGLCYIVTDAEIRIHDATYNTVNLTKILIPGLADPVTHKGSYISILVVVALVVLLIGLFVAHFTRFGRTVYAMGGGNGANEQSSRLMGLPVNRTKVLVYVISGFCSALAGITYSIYVGSGHGTHATGFELTVIAAVVIGGTALTGGEGFLIGSLFGVLITALIQSLIQFNGQLSSWWTSIFIGALLLLFLAVQSLLAAWNVQALGRARGGSMARSNRPSLAARFQANLLKTGIILGVVVVVAVAGSFALGAIGGGGGGPAATACVRAPLRPDQVKSQVSAGAVIVEERNGGNGCVDELYAIYADGKIVTDLSGKTTNSTMPAGDVATLIKAIKDYGWFTDNMYTTTHTPCGACYTYSITIVDGTNNKSVGAVDGGTDAPSNYWLITGKLSAILYPDR
jgi:ribose/xylose/arabinose/galactoside ABC-type transport system permease subunit